MNYTLCASCIFKGVNQNLMVSFTNNTDDKNDLTVRKRLNSGVEILSAFNRSVDENFDTKDISVNSVVSGNAKKQQESTEFVSYLEAEIGFKNINKGYENEINIGDYFVYKSDKINIPFTDDVNYDSIISRLRNGLIPLFATSYETIDDVNMVISYLNIKIL